MQAWLPNLFDSSAFMPHGHCYLWEPGLLWLQVVSNGLIGLSYVAISITLVYMIKQGDYLPFKGMALAFGLFIVTCGVTHFMDIYVIWHPAYWVDGVIRAITAGASVGTAVLLPPLVPRAIALARGARAARDRGVALESLVHELAEMVEKTRELDKLKTQFFANVSHELRTPLTLILGPTQRLARADDLTDQQRADLEVVVRNAKTLLKHVDDLLDVSRLEAGKLEVHYRRIDLAELTRVVAAHFDGLVVEREMDFTLEVPAMLQAEVDVDKIRRVLLNLLSNAFKFTAERGRIRVTVARHGAEARIEVADDGPGIPPRHRKAVFERFHQIDGGATRKYGGTGLGLAIASDFVSLHGGSIEVTDAPEGGALFRVRVPTRAPEGKEVEAERVDPGLAREVSSTHHALAELRAQTQAASYSTPHARGKVLVVEDNPDMNRFLCEVLAEDYDVEAALDGREGFDRALAEPPDLIVSDIMMPRMSGDELVRAVRTHPELAHVPLLMLSAKADEELRTELLRRGAQDYVTKPFAAEELRARVGNLVEMKRVRDVLQREIGTQLRDLEAMAGEVTHRKRDLELALESMRVAREHAERASQLKSNFLRVVSHELRSPLATLQIQLERLRIESAEASGGAVPTLVSRMSDSAARLRNLIDELLHYTRIQSGKLSVSAESVDLVAVARDVLDQLRAPAERKRLDLRVEAAPELPPLWSDPRLVRLVLVNLADNAVKYTREGEVVVRLEFDGTRHRFAVADTGPGIPVQEQSRIFEPFEQLERAGHKHVEGVGLGLALVSDVVRTLGGTISVDSKVGVGSTFEVSLPAWQERRSDNRA